MQRLEVSGAVRPLYGSLGVKGLIFLGRLVSWFLGLGDLSLKSLYLCMVFKEVNLTSFHILCEDTVVAE